MDARCTLATQRLHSVMVDEYFTGGQPQFAHRGGMAPGRKLGSVSRKDFQQNHKVT